MTTTANATAARRTPAAISFAAWMIGGCIVIAVTLLAGVGVAALLARRGAAAEWSRWSDVGQTFGALSSIISGLALATVVITARMQFREMQQSRAELEHQRRFLMDNHSELRRTAAANLGQLHLEILKLSIDDSRLAEVWPPFGPNLSTDLNRQYMYANIIYQFSVTSLNSGSRTDEEVIGNLKYLFSSPLIRAYWRAAERARKPIPPNSPEFMVAQKADEICREYEAVVESAGKKDAGSSPTSLHERHGPAQAA